MDFNADVSSYLAYGSTSDPPASTNQVLVHSERFLRQESGDNEPHVCHCGFGPQSRMSHATGDH